jgi:hypothetical protein
MAGSYFEPDFVYSEERTKYMQEMDFDKHLVHAVKGGQLEDLEEITIPVAAELDDKWATYSVDFINKMAESDKPFFLYHCTRGGHFDNYPIEVPGQVAGEVPQRTSWLRWTTSWAAWSRRWRIRASSRTR